MIHILSCRTKKHQKTLSRPLTFKVPLKLKDFSKLCKSWQILHTDDVPLPRCKWCFWLSMVMPQDKFALTNQRHYPDLGCNRSSVLPQTWFLRKTSCGLWNVGCFLRQALRPRFIKFKTKLKIGHILFLLLLKGFPSCSSTEGSLSFATFDLLAGSSRRGVARGLFSVGPLICKQTMHINWEKQLASVQQHHIVNHFSFPMHLSQNHLLWTGLMEA